MKKSRDKKGLKVLGIVAGLFGIGWLVKKVWAKPPDIKLSELLIEPQQVNPGDIVNISVLAINSGNKTASKEIVCEVI